MSPQFFGSGMMGGSSRYFKTALTGPVVDSYWLMEDGISKWTLEDGSGFWILE